MFPAQLAQVLFIDFIDFGCHDVSNVTFSYAIRQHENVTLLNFFLMEQENREFMALLEASGWTQAEAARRLHLSPSNISQYKTNANRPSKQVLELFKLLLLSENPKVLTAANQTKALDDAATKYLATAERELSKLPEEERARVVEMIDDIVNYAAGKLRKKKKA